MVVTQKQSGFTLVELVMVMILLGALSAVALPRFFNRNSFDQRVFFDDTLNAIRYAQKQAVATGCRCQFLVENNQYIIYRDTDCDTADFEGTTTINHPVTNKPYQGRQKNVSLSAREKITVFDPLGRASTDNSITVGSRTISVIAETGFSFANE